MTFSRNKGKGDSKMTKEVNLLVNDTPIELDYFVEGFIDHTIGGMIAALEGTGEIESLNVSIKGDIVEVNLNNALVPTNLFVNKILKNTIAGMVSPLKGVSEINSVNISIKR